MLSRAPVFVVCRGIPKQLSRCDSNRAHADEYLPGPRLRARHLLLGEQRLRCGSIKTQRFHRHCPSTSSCTVHCRALERAPQRPQTRYHTQCWYRLWYYLSVNTARKITVEVPVELLEKAQKASGTGVTQTVRAGLQLIAASQDYAQLRALRGKVRFSRTAAELKTDR
jgi:hypothetical protein